MRDVIVFGIIFGLVPLMIKRPAIGALVFMWISLMNPHRLTWGPAYSFPFAMMVAVITIGAILFSREPRDYPAKPVTVLLIVFMVWVTITTLFAISPPGIVNYEWTRVIKTLLMVAVTILVVQRKFCFCPQRHTKCIPCNTKRRIITKISCAQPIFY